MITLKQIEALVWIVRLGSFERAAEKLNTTQSTISKRIRDLEVSARLRVFDRSHREARLTADGESLMAIGLQMLELRDRAHALPAGAVATRPRLRLGVTELTALTWLPALVGALRGAFPTTKLEPVVDMSRSLFEGLYDGTLDVIIVPDAFSDPEITRLSLGTIENAWMASPLLAPAPSAIDLRIETFLTQGGRSGSSILIARWLKEAGLDVPTTLVCDSLVAQLGLTVAGLGISCLPRHCLAPLVETGKLVAIDHLPRPPAIPYAAMHRNDQPTAFVSAVGHMAAGLCDFSRILALPA